jgi:O-acetylhomoserine (thiol)-lyase
VYPNLLRVSVGIEHIEDLKADLRQAFDKLPVVQPTPAQPELVLA